MSTAPRSRSARRSALRAFRAAPLAVAALISAASSPQAYGQPPAAFDVASVKPEPWKGQGGVGVTIHGDTLTGEHVCLYDLVEFAYNLTDNRISGGPDWAVHGVLASSTLYQVIGKAEGDPVPTQEQFRQMLQTLLADRFGLKLRPDAKVFPTYDLGIAKGGPKLRESAPDAKFSMVIDSGNPTRIRAVHAPVAALVGHLANFTGRPVFDKTGLAGAYDFEIEFTPDGLVAAAPDSAGPDFGGPSLFAVLQGRLGLKLEPGTAPSDTVVIERATKPAEN